FLSISIAIIIGLLIGYIDDVGSAFSLSRTFAFFPFFLTGYFLTKKHFVFLKKPTMRIIKLSIVIIMFVLIYTLPDFISGWLLASNSYSHLVLSNAGVLVWLLVYFISSLMVMCFFCRLHSERL